MKRQLPCVVVTSMVALLAVIVVNSARPVQAQETTPLPNNATSLCLDSNTDGDVYTMEYNGGKFQTWIFFSGRTPIQNLATELCLDSNFDGDVYTLPCNDGDFQLWERLDTADGIYFQNHATGLCLDSNFDGDVYTLECNYGPFQAWR